MILLCETSLDKLYVKWYGTLFVHNVVVVRKKSLAPRSEVEQCQQVLGVSRRLCVRYTITKGDIHLTKANRETPMKICEV